MMIPGYPWKIVQTPSLMVILFESFTDFRQIFTDGRDFPEERAPTWMGYSTGKWEGDTFVVRSLGFNDKGWLDDGGHPRSEEMKVTERFRRLDWAAGDRVHVRRSEELYQTVERDRAVHAPPRRRDHREFLRKRA